MTLQFSLGPLATISQGFYKEWDGEVAVFGVFATRINAERHGLHFLDEVG